MVFGKENDNDVKGEGNQQDYGMRVYDPRTARFLSEDPITKNFPSLSPFQFASNSPMRCIDLDGSESNSVTWFNLWIGDIWRDLSSGKRWSEAGDNVNDNFNPLYIASNHVYKISTNEDLRGRSNDSRGRMGAATDAAVDVIATLSMNRFFKGTFGTPLLEGELNTYSLAAQSPVKPKPGSNQPLLEAEVKATTAGRQTSPETPAFANVTSAPIVKPQTARPSLKTPGDKTIMNSKWANQNNPAALTSGFTIPVKANGYPDFSKYLYTGGVSPVGAVNAQNTQMIRMTGSYKADFALANRAAGFKKTSDGFTWHHAEVLGEAADKNRNARSC